MVKAEQNQFMEKKSTCQTVQWKPSKRETSLVSVGDTFSGHFQVRKLLISIE